MRRFAVLMGLVFAACGEPALPLPDGGELADAGPYQCSPSNCTGCCSNNICRGGNEAEACGYDGRGCSPCPASTTCMAPGACIGTPKDGGAFEGSYNPDAGGGTLEDPLTGNPLKPPGRACVYIFGIPICG